jgi:hypothetical protein
MGVPSARGRIALARAAGVAVETYPVGVKDSITLDVDGDVAEVKPNPDERPTKWEHLRGVIVRVEDVRTGAVRRHWVSAGELAERKAKAKPDKNGKLRTWEGDPIAMARSKALSIMIDRGTIPQAPLPVPGLREWYATAAPALQVIDAPAARALPAPTEPEPADTLPAAPTAPETAPAEPDVSAPAEPDVSAPAEAEPAATEAPATAGEGAAVTLPSGDLLDLCSELTAAAFDDRVISDDDAQVAAYAAIEAWTAGMTKAGRPVTIEAARAVMPRLITRAREIAGNPPAREA